MKRVLTALVLALGLVTMSSVIGCGSGSPTKATPAGGTTATTP